MSRRANKSNLSLDVEKAVKEHKKYEDLGRVVEIRQNPPNYITNPKTGKLVKVGGRTFHSLVREKLLDMVNYAKNMPEKVKARSVVAECDTASKTVMQKKKLQKEQPPPDGKMYAISNNGKQVLLRNKKTKGIKADHYIDNVSKATTNVYKKLQGEYDENDNFDDDTQEMFRQMIYEELLNMEKKSATNNIQDNGQAIQNDGTDGCSTEDADNY
jgi:hypothetical protein